MGFKLIWKDLREETGALKQWQSFAIWEFISVTLLGLIGKHHDTKVFTNQQMLKQIIPYHQHLPTFLSFSVILQYCSDSVIRLRSQITNFTKIPSMLKNCFYHDQNHYQTRIWAAWTDQKIDNDFRIGISENNLSIKRREALKEFNEGF